MPDPASTGRDAVPPRTQTSSMSGPPPASSETGSPATVETKPVSSVIRAEPTPTNSPTSIEETRPGTPHALQVHPASAGPSALSAWLDTDGGLDAFVLPADAALGLAAFRRGDNALVVFDQRRPFDLAALRAHKLLAGARIQMLAAGTLLSIPLPRDKELSISRHRLGWRITLGSPSSTVEPIRVAPKDARLMLATAGANKTVTMADPETGSTLLIGTLRQSGQAILVTRHWPLFSVPRSWQGVVIEPLSDALSLRAEQEGFVLAGGPAGLAIGGDPEAATQIAGTSRTDRLFNLPNHELAQLLARSRTQLREAAAAPALARGRPRRELGQTLIALGLGAEAEAVLRVAATDDPREAEAPENIGLSAIAALLAGRLDDATGLHDKRLDGAEDIRFWRAVARAMRREGDPQAAADFVATGKIPLSYATTLRERLLPLVAETMLLAGQTVPARKLLESQPESPALEYARALLAQADGQPEEALAKLTVLSRSRDRLMRAKAAPRAVELRLARGELKPDQAAAALERLLYIWRGDERDLSLRQRVIDLHVQAGSWRPALALLRDTEEAFPEAKADIQTRHRQVIAQLLQDAAMDRMRPLELVSLVDENADLMPDGPAGIEVASRLSDRLLALDLPRRATELLRKLIAHTPPGPVRAQFGARLASLRLQEADPGGTLAALDLSAAPDLPEPLREERTVLAARAQAQQGDPSGAIALLAGLKSETALRARAGILEEQHNWPMATAALRALVDRTVPAEGKLSEAQQRGLLRLATAAAQAGDSAELALLRSHDLPRLAPGPIADLFRLLTSDSIQSVADLARSGRELALARALSAEPTQR